MEGTHRSRRVVFAYPVAVVCEFEGACMNERWLVERTGGKREKKVEREGIK